MLVRVGESNGSLVGKDLSELHLRSRESVNPPAVDVEDADQLAPNLLRCANPDCARCVYLEQPVATP